MTIWGFPDASIQPSVTLCDWTIALLDNGEVHLIGRDVYDFSGRVSSLIVNANLDAMLFTTRSGRVYSLKGINYGEPCGDAAYVWDRWCQMNYVTGFKYINAKDPAVLALGEQNDNA